MSNSRLPVTNDAGFYEARFESIGGLGANVAGQILAEALVLRQGFNGANFSSYGSEKKGSPVTSFIRICECDRQVRSSSPVERPHLLALFHEQVIGIRGTTEGLYPDSIVVVNSPSDPDTLRDIIELPSGTVVSLDAMKIAIEEKSRINTAMLGAIVRASGFMDREAVRTVVAETFCGKYPALVEPNLRTFDRGFEEARIKSFQPDGRYEARPYQRLVPKMGYETQPLGGAIVNPGNTVIKDLSSARHGYYPQYHRDRCIDCGLCDMTCPDYVFVFKMGVDKRGKPAPVMQGPNLQYCKGCLRCVEICPVAALTAEREENLHKQPSDIQLIGPTEAIASLGKADIEPSGRAFDEEKAAEYMSGRNELRTCEANAGEPSDTENPLVD